MADARAAAQAAVRHILESPCLADRCRPLLAGGEVDWPVLLAEADAMSGGQRLLVHVAHDLWAGTGAVRLRQVACALDSTHLERVVTALRFVHGDEAAASRAGFRVAA